MIDVAIIGGGPAGITAGTILQKQGYKTCIIDSQVFPREKLCAGVITSKANKLIQHVYSGLDLKRLEIYYIDKISFFYKQNAIGEYSIKNKYGVVDRIRFDNELLQYYKKVGGQVLEGQRNYQVMYDKNMIRLADGKEIIYQCLIGADGINSRIREYVQHSWNAAILCFEKFLPNNSEENIIKIYFGNIIGGYCWRIPGKDKIGVGLGGFYIRGMKRNVKKYSSYFKKEGIDDLDNIKGAFVSCGRFVKKPVKNNVMLVGDAAGLIDAMTGEGIYFAMESGRQAAMAITEYFENNIPLINYNTRIKKIHNRMKEQNIYNKLLFVPILQKITILYMKKNLCFVHAVLDNAISSYKSGYTFEIVRNSRLCGKRNRVKKD